MKDNNAYIDLIIAACKKISEFMAGLDEDAFLKQSVTQSAVLMQLQSNPFPITSSQPLHCQRAALDGEITQGVAGLHATG